MPPEKPSSSGPSAPLDCAPLKETYVRCVQAWLRERWQRLDLSPADCGDAFQVRALARTDRT